MQSTLWIHLLVCCAAMLPAAEVSTLLHPDNMAELHCLPPDASVRFAGSNAAGQVFIAGEAVHLKAVLASGWVGQLACGLEIQEIGTRTPGKVTKSRRGWTDTTGFAAILDRIGAPVQHAFTVAQGAAADVPIEIRDVPVPKRFGTYAVLLILGDKRQFLCTLARVPDRVANGTIETTPIFGEGGFMHGDDRPARARIYARMGIRGWRTEASWNESENGTIDWQAYDQLFAAAKDAGCKAMVTLGAHPRWSMPFQTPTPGALAGNPNWDGNPYMGQADWLCDPKYEPRYEKWLAAFCARYWQDGQGGLWGLENYNEAWEGGGISGWASDCLRYRGIQRLIARAARSVDPRIRLLAASSIMNTEDKFYSDGSTELDQYVDIFTDHYVTPCMSYGPLVAAAHGKQSMESETWMVGTEYELPQAVAQFMATGQSRITPWHPRALFDVVSDSSTDATMMPTPVVAATAAFNAFTTGKRFEKMPFRDHLPWVFQFGTDDDATALLVMFGRLVPVHTTDERTVLWSQVNSSMGGTMTIDNHDGLLQFFDLSGNPVHVGEALVTLPCDIFPSYIRCAQGPKAAVARLATMQITGKRPVEILPHDFTTAVMANGAALNVSLHNCLPMPLSGMLSVDTPDGLVLATAEHAVLLAAGETRNFAFPLTTAAANEANAYPCRFRFASAAGNAEYAETLNAAIVPCRTITVDGKLDDWEGIPGVSVFASEETIDSTELLRRPWLQVQTDKAALVAGRVRLAWDDGHLYICGEIKDGTPEANAIRFGTRDENSFFHTAADDARQPFKRFLEAPRGDLGGKSLKDLGHTFAEVFSVYATSPEAGIPFRRDRLQFALDTSDGWHDLQSTTDRVPYGYHAVPDSDYEYSIYGCLDSAGEVWRQLAPGVPRMHDCPRQPRGTFTTGVVSGAQIAVSRTDRGYIYECALPAAELAELKLAAGTTFGFTFKVGNSAGAQPEYGRDKAVCKQNGLTLHPYWESTPSTGVRWTLVQDSMLRQALP